MFIEYLWLCPLQENLSVTDVSDVQEIDMLAFICVRNNRHDNSNIHIETGK